MKNPEIPIPLVVAVGLSYIGLWLLFLFAIWGGAPEGLYWRLERWKASEEKWKASEENQKKIAKLEIQNQRIRQILKRPSISLKIFSPQEIY